MLTLNQLSESKQVLKIIGNQSTIIKKLVELKTYAGNPEELTWCNDKNIAALNNFKSGSIICSPLILKHGIKDDVNYIISEQPRRLFQEILVKFFYTPPVLGLISINANIHTSVKLGKNVSIGNFTTIEEGCQIGDHVYIGHNNTILKNTKIGNQVSIGNNNTIGGIGFGYEKDEDGNFQLIPHIGNVEIKNNVEIGNNTCIDRAVLGSTIINDNCKIDNLVHIAHNVEVGSNSVIIANALIGGSVKIGKNVWIAPTASIMNGISIGDATLVGLGAVVIRPVEANCIMVGNPAKNIKK